MRLWIAKMLERRATRQWDRHVRNCDACGDPDRCFCELGHEIFFDSLMPAMRRVLRLEGW